MVDLHEAAPERVDVDRRAAALAPRLAIVGISGLVADGNGTMDVPVDLGPLRLDGFIAKPLKDIERMCAVHESSGCACGQKKV